MLSLRAMILLLLPRATRSRISISRGEGRKPNDLFIDGKLASRGTAKRRQEHVGIGTCPHVCGRADSGSLEQLGLRVGARDEYDYRLGLANPEETGHLH